MSRAVTRVPKYSRSQRIFILSCLNISAVLVLGSLRWLFEEMQNGWGTEVARVILTLIFIAVLIIVAAGVGLGLAIDYSIAHCKHIFRKPQPGSWVEKAIRLWGYTLVECPRWEASDTAPTVPKPLPEKAVRRGRKPTFPLTKWVEVALMWEQRDPLYDTFTLSDVIALKLGRTPNGEPIMSDNAYYGTWRIPAIREINRLGLTSQPLSEELREKSGD